MSISFSTLASSPGFTLATPISFHESEFSKDPSHPSLSNPCEKRICRQGSDRVHYIVFNTEKSTEFMQWWTQTKWYNEHRNVSITWTVNKKHSEAWEHFSPAARLKDGEPWVLCTRCSEALSHPSVRGTGTSSMTRHIATKGCVARARRLGKAPVQEKTRAKILVCRRSLQRLLHYSNYISSQTQLRQWFLMVPLSSRRKNGKNRL
jgi:hypothetical protein